MTQRHYTQNLTHQTSYLVQLTHFLSEFRVHLFNVVDSLSVVIHVIYLSKQTNKYNIETEASYISMEMLIILM